MAKKAINGHMQPWRLQTCGSVRIKVGSSKDTSRAICWDLFLGPECPPGGRHKAPKWPKKAINGPFVAISRPGSSKLVDQCGSRFDQVRVHLGRCVTTYSKIQNGTYFFCKNHKVCTFVSKITTFAFFSHENHNIHALLSRKSKHTRSLVEIKKIGLHKMGTARGGG